MHICRTLNFFLIFYPLQISADNRGILSEDLTNGVSIRSVREDHGVDAATNDGDSDYWLWSSVSRLKRSISNLLSTGEPHDQHHHNVHVSDKERAHSKPKKRSHRAMLMKRANVDRSKRQDHEYGDSDLEDDDEDHLNAGSGQGPTSFNPSDLLPNEQGARLCECRKSNNNISLVSHGMDNFSIDLYFRLVNSSYAFYNQ